MKDKILAILERIRPESDFAGAQDYFVQGLLDSFDMVTLVTELESTFGVSIDGTDVLPENFNSLVSIEKLLRKRATT
jgi:acyl carrier protein